MHHRNERRNLAADGTTAAGLDRRRQSTRRVEGVLREVLHALPKYPDPARKADDIMNGRSAAAATVLYVLHGVRERGGSRALADAVVQAFAAEVDALWADEADPCLMTAVVDDERAEGEENAVQPLALVVGSEHHMAAFERCVERAWAAKTALRTAVRIARRRAGHGAA